MEIWKTIENFEDYQVSNLGRVKSLKNGKEIIKKVRVCKKGYCYVFLYKKNKQTTISVHRLVTAAFIGKSNLGVNHKDLNKLNNCLENLEYLTHRENSIHYHNLTKKSSNFVGISWYEKRGKWKSNIQINGKYKFLGYFKNEIDASNAYQNALKLLKS